MTMPINQPNGSGMSEATVAYQLGQLNESQKNLRRDLDANTRTTRETMNSVQHLDTKIDSVEDKVDTLLRLERNRRWWTKLAVGTTITAAGTVLATLWEHLKKRVGL